ncbi:MAG: HD domain-containing protein [Agathobacter sp.]
MSRNEILLTYGYRILECDLFADARMQKHHLRTDVASHSINTALFCIAFYKILSFFHIKLNIAMLVVAALAHDLGILGRSQKFSSNFECLKVHPKDSVTVIQGIIPNIDSKICDAIASHMFPLCPIVPNSKEAWLLSIADKCAACTDFFRHYGVPELAIA